MSKPKPNKQNKITKETTETLIYCGPSLKNGTLQQFSVFKNKLPIHVLKITEEKPVLKELFVTPSKLAETKKNIGIEGARENQLFKIALGYSEGGSK